MGLVFALSAWAQQKPVAPGFSPAKLFTQDQVKGLVRDGLGDESGAKLIEQRGIDFAPAEDFLQSLKAAGASEVFLKALRGAKQPEPASAKKPLNQVEVFALLTGQVPSHRVAALVKERGIDFEPQDDYLQEVRLGGGGDELINALKSAKVAKPATVDPVVETRQANVRQHVAHGVELAKKGQYADAEQEYRAALLLDSQNADVYVSLANVLLQQQKWDDAASAGREAARLNPNNAFAHVVLGAALLKKGDVNGDVTECREALRLDQNNEVAHFALGLALGGKGDWDGAIAEYREVLRIDPKYESMHAELGAALGNKGDWDGDFAEEREALRAHPNNANAHLYLGVALCNKGDMDGAIAEFREALRLNPNETPAHLGLGAALEGKGDRRGALEEYREAYLLDPKNPIFKQNYERLLRQPNK
jgi:tetratricopeptide (TPR) repeat protein